jgi:hypothetical protein
MLSTNAPFAEVLAVVGEQAITIFTEARACTSDRFTGVEPGVSPVANLEPSTCSELIEADLFDLSSPDEPAVLSDRSVAQIDPVMGVARARRNDVRSGYESEPAHHDAALKIGCCLPV